MKKNYSGIINSILVIILIITIYFALRPVQFVKLYQNRFEVIEKSLETIEKNMEEIVTDATWSSLKDIPKAEETQVDAYNSIVKDIKSCYLQEKDLGDESSDNIKILSYKEKRTIPKQELKAILDNDTCINNFEKYNTMVFSKDKNLNEKLQKQISLIINSELTNIKTLEFDEALSREANIIHNIANLSGWLKIEYNTYK
ncbi:MAG: hypothetical protein GX265_01350 [Mollicutes bacterium]|nr:hypothetical protein [Mollicutes bacterium]